MITAPKTTSRKQTMFANALTAAATQAALPTLVNLLDRTIRVRDPETDQPIIICVRHLRPHHVRAD